MSTRIQGFIDKLSDAPKVKDVAWMFDAPAVNFSQSVVDEKMRANLTFQGEAGLPAKVHRYSIGGCCPWCDALEGEYEYPNVPDDVWRRHDNCNCIIEYTPKGGGRLDRLTGNKKSWDLQSREYIEARKNFAGIDITTGVMVATQRSTGQVMESYTSRGIDIPQKDKNILRALKKEGQYYTANTGTYTFNDLAILSAETTDEFAKVVIKDKEYIIRGNNNGVTIPKTIVDLAKENNGFFEAHSHAYIGDITPSPLDLQALKIFQDAAGQEYSYIVAPDNSIARYNVYGIIEKNIKSSNSLTDEDKEAIKNLFKKL